MQILLREEPEQEYVELVSFKTESLSLEQAIGAMAPIIDQNQFKIVDIISAKSRNMKHLSAYSLEEKERVEAVGIISNGKTTIEVVDYETKIRHHTIQDPIIRITGVDAKEIGIEIAENIVRVLVGSLLGVKKMVLEDLKDLTENAETIIKGVLDEARLELLRRLKTNV